MRRTHVPPTLQRAWRLLAACGLAGLVAGCAFPKRDYSMVPDASIIQVQLQDGSWVAVPPECQRLFTEAPAPWYQYDSRPQVAFGCATYTNLANSVARPRDLSQPKAYGGQNADTAASAVTRYRQGEVTPLMDNTATKTQGN